MQAPEIIHKVFSCAGDNVKGLFSKVRLRYGKGTAVRYGQIYLSAYDDDYCNATFLFLTIENLKTEVSLHSTDEREEEENNTFSSHLLELQMQPPRGVLRKRCSERMQQIYRRTTMPKCDFSKVAVFSWKFAAYFQNTFS